MSGYSFADFSPILLDHFENPRNAGQIENPDGAGRAGNPACGDVMELTLRIKDGVIQEARFRTSGCSAAIAGSSMTTVLLAGRTLEEAGALTNQDVASALGGLPPTKLHCSVLAEEAVRAALADYRRRNLS